MGLSAGQRAATTSSWRCRTATTQWSARAAARSPAANGSAYRSPAPIVILDEATASIDPENEHLIQAALSELTRGRTIVTITHRLATIRNADQILAVDDGRIAEHGTHGELMKRYGVYRRFIEIRERAEGRRIAGE